MAKLHELLAVEGDLEGTFKSILNETETSFSKKAQLFFGFHKRCVMFDDDVEPPPAESMEMTTTVGQKMEYTADHIIRYFDALLQKECTNQEAVADLIVDGNTIAEKVPATFLLGLEKRLKLVRNVMASMPVLPNGIKWTEDPNRGEGVYLSETPEENFKTAKTFRFKVLYEATETHPAQIEKWEEQVNVGKYSKTTWAGMLTTARKSAILGRMDKLIRAVKRARQKANTTKVVERQIGQALFDYLDTF